MSIKLGFIGTGSMGLSHVHLVRDEFPQIQLAAIYDSYEPNLQKAHDAAPAAKVCKNIDELLAADLNAVVISTPGHLHADHAEQALRAGKHIFAEKPVMTTLAGCKRMLDLANRHPRQVVAINHELRYSAYFAKMKQLVDAGEVGNPRLVWCREFRIPFLKKVNDWIQDSRFSGGCLVDKNCHHFDLMNWWIGSRPARVCGFGGNDVVHVVNNEYEVIDHASVSFEYENGVRGGLLLCMFAPRTGADLEMGVIGDAGLIQTKMETDEILQFRRAETSATPIVHKLPTRRVGWGAHYGGIEAHAAFFDAIDNSTTPLTDVRNCVDGTLLAIAAEEAIKKGSVIDIAKWRA